jgi:hypothetical protein
MKDQSERFHKLIETARAIAWNHPKAGIAKGWNTACIATGDHSFMDGYSFKDEILEIYQSYNNHALWIIRVESGTPTATINAYGKVIRKNAELWKLEDHIEALGKETPTVKKTGFFSQYFRHICLHVQPSTTSTYSIQIGETSEGKVAIEDIRGIDKKDWDKVPPEGLEKVTVLYSEAAKVLRNFDQEHRSLIRQPSKQKL